MASCCNICENILRHLFHLLYSLYVASSDNHIFRSMAHGLKALVVLEEVQNWIDSSIASKDDKFFQRGIAWQPELWDKVVATYGHYFERHIYNQFFTIYFKRWFTTSVICFQIFLGIIFINFTINNLTVIIFLNKIY